MIRKNHDWTDADEALLSQAVMDLDPLREQYEERGIPTKEFWSAAAGRIAPQVVVTGKACRERWCTIEARRKAAEQPAEPDAWAQVAARVEQYERELGEATYDEAQRTNARLLQIEGLLADVATADDVTTVFEQVKAVEAKVDRLLAEWTGSSCAKATP